MWKTHKVVDITIPKDRCHAKGCSDVANPVINITKRRPPALNSDTENILDNLLAEVKFGKDLLVGKAGHVTMRPRVSTDLVAVSQTTLRFQGPIDDVGANVKQRSFLVGLTEIIIVGIYRACD